MKRYALLLALVMSSILACVPPSTVSQQGSQPARPLNYSYTPPNPAPAGSAKVTVAVVQPQWTRDDPTTESLSEFATALKNDFMALLNARGFNTRGPFDSYQAMVYPDKTGSDLVLTPEMQVTWAFSDIKTAQAQTSFMESILNNKGTAPVVVNGTVTIRGAINLLLSESMTNERMWSKSIKVDPIVVAWAGKKLYRAGVDAPLVSPVAIREFITTDPGFQSAVFPKLEAMYQAVLQKGWDYLDPREVAMVKAQAAELKKKKSQ